jgi:BirA family biotin operon repressor/biotin-[acetyl-CoA-carboxylase] ligase
VEFGQVILADEQTQGRGQREALWVSEVGKNLLFSVYITLDNLSVTNQLTLMQYTAVSVCSTLNDLGIEAQIKWPNDIVVQGVKIGGILIENQLVGSKIVSSIIGVGLNVNQLKFENLNATSLREQLGIEQNRIDVLEKVLNKLNDFFPYIEIESSTLNTLYLENLYQLNLISTYYCMQLGEFQGEITGVDPFGKLRVNYNNNELLFEVKEIKFL